MTQPRKVRGLLGILEADARGEKWELESPSPNFVPGMGFLATPEATRWAFIGMCQELAQKMKRPAHRPSIAPNQSKDAARAFAAWQMCRDLRKLYAAKGRGADAQFTSRELVRCVQAAEDAANLPARERYFPRKKLGSWDASVSRGKRILRIDDNWHSPLCEELLASFSKTT